MSSDATNRMATGFLANAIYINGTYYRGVPRVMSDQSAKDALHAEQLERDRVFVGLHELDGQP